MLMTLPKIDVQIRPGNPGDIPFIDCLQKKYNKNLGFLQTQALEGKIELQQVLVAEVVSGQCSVAREGNALTTDHSPLTTPVGYIIAADRYFKRDEVGYITQLVVAPNQQRGFIGAALLKAQFDRSAYGCRLYCCWCAQDLAANRFWESMGFVALAFRNGSEKKGKDGKPRVHIFWEKKIRGNEDAVNWWYPAKTDQGAMRADRLAFPIPPGTHWSEVQPVELPVLEGSSRLLPDRSKTAAPKKKPIVNVRLQWGPPDAAEETKMQEPPAEKPKVKAPKVKVKIDPKFIAASRELRDRYLEEVNERGYRLESRGKYDVVRKIEDRRQGTAALQIAA